MGAEFSGHCLVGEEGEYPVLPDGAAYAAAELVEVLFVAGDATRS